MNSKKHRKYNETAKALPAYCIYPDDYHFSDAWGDKLIAGWISLKRVQVESKWDNARFRDALIDLVIELSEGWEAEFLEAARQEGMTFDWVSYEVQEQMHQAYIQAHRERAFDLIPNGLHYAVSLIPFFLVNGVLTGWLLPEPIVWYNNAENLDIRLNTIPIEDGMYLLFFLLIVTTFYERALKRY